MNNVISSLKINFHLLVKCLCSLVLSDCKPRRLTISVLSQLRQQAHDFRVFLQCFFQKTVDTRVKTIQFAHKCQPTVVTSRADGESVTSQRLIALILHDIRSLPLALGMRRKSMTSKTIVCLSQAKGALVKYISTNPNNTQYSQLQLPQPQASNSPFSASTTPPFTGLEFPLAS